MKVSGLIDWSIVAAVAFNLASALHFEYRREPDYQRAALSLTKGLGLLIVYLLLSRR